MDDLQTLHARMKKLSEPAQLPARRTRILRVSHALPATTALQEEIAETQLPTRLRFRNDRGEELKATVARGRVEAIDFNRAGHHGESITLPADPSEIPSEAGARLASALALFTEDVRWLDVASRPAVEHTQMAGGGLLPTALFDALGRLDCRAQDPTPKGVMAFLEICRPQISACVVMEQGVFTVAEGQSAQVGALKAQALEEYREAARTAAHMEPNSVASDGTACVVYSGAPDQGQSVLCAEDAGALVLLAFEHRHLISVLDIWRNTHP